MDSISTRSVWNSRGGPSVIVSMVCSGGVSDGRVGINPRRRSFLTAGDARTREPVYRLIFFSRRMVLVVSGGLNGHEIPRTIQGYVGTCYRYRNEFVSLPRRTDGTLVGRRPRRHTHSFFRTATSLCEFPLIVATFTWCPTDPTMMFRCRCMQ
jgi:hypothetical protein